MSISSTVSSSVSTVGSSVGVGGGVSYDAAALDYFTRAEALGGSFDQTGINATYTESYVKSAIDTFILGCKEDSIWTKLTEVYLLAGVSFAGLTAKLKHAGTATLTNTNFVSGDYVAVGSGAGLKGNGSSKYLDTGLPQNALTAGNRGLAVYETVRIGPNYEVQIGSWSAANTHSFMLLGDSLASWQQYWSSSGASGPVVNGAATSGFWSGNSASATSLELYKNGSLVAGPTVVGEAVPSAHNLYCFALNNAGSPSNYCSGRMSMHIVKQTLTATQEANLNTRVQALMTAIGANV